MKSPLGKKTTVVVDPQSATVQRTVPRMNALAPRERYTAVAVGAGLLAGLGGSFLKLLFFYFGLSQMKCSTRREPAPQVTSREPAPQVTTGGRDNEREQQGNSQVQSISPIVTLLPLAVTLSTLGAFAGCTGSSLFLFGGGGAGSLLPWCSSSLSLPPVVTCGAGSRGVRDNTLEQPGTSQALCTKSSTFSAA